MVCLAHNVSAKKPDDGIFNRHLTLMPTQDSLITCPKCGFSQPDSQEECMRCGVIFSKIGIQPRREGTSASPAGRDDTVRRPMRGTTEKRRTEDSSPRAPATERRAARAPDSTRAPLPGKPIGVPVPVPRLDEDEEDVLVSASHVDEDEEGAPELRRLEKEDWLVLGAGLVIALIVMAIPLFNHIFMTFVVLIHEMGHFITGWLFAYPSVPAFDLQYGGGVTLHGQRSLALLACIYAFVGFLLYTYRKNVRTVILLVVLLTVHVLLSISEFHQVVFLFMGHGTELVIAAIFFYRAMSGAAVVHSVERPLYAALSLFIVVTDVRFAYRLMTSSEARHMYQEAKGGGHWMDFSRIAEDYLNVHLSSVALFFFLACLLPLVVGFILFRYQEFIRSWIVRRWKTDPSEV